MIWKRWKQQDEEWSWGQRRKSKGRSRGGDEGGVGRVNLKEVSTLPKQQCTSGGREGGASMIEEEKEEERSFLLSKEHQLPQVKWVDWEVSLS
jgi:hypothetical protein